MDDFKCLEMRHTRANDVLTFIETDSYDDDDIAVRVTGEYKGKKFACIKIVRDEIFNMPGMEDRILAEFKASVMEMKAE